MYLQFVDSNLKYFYFCLFKINSSLTLTLSLIGNLSKKSNKSHPSQICQFKYFQYLPKLEMEIKYKWWILLQCNNINPSPTVLEKRKRFHVSSIWNDSPHIMHFIRLMFDIIKSHIYKWLFDIGNETKFALALLLSWNHFSLYLVSPLWMCLWLNELYNWYFNNVGV